MTRKDIEHYTKLYMQQRLNQLDPSTRQVDEYVDFSIKYFGSEAEYVRVLEWYFNL